MALSLRLKVGSSSRIKRRKISTVNTSPKIDVRAPKISDKMLAKIKVKQLVESGTILKENESGSDYFKIC